MPKVRFFILITFSDNHILIDFLSLITRVLGKYDFFTQDIRYSFDIAGNLITDSRYKMKIASFKKLQSLDKCKYLLKKTGQIQDKLISQGYSNFQLTCGYLNRDHVISLYNTASPERVYVKKNLFAQIQLLFKNGKVSTSKLENKEFSVPDTKKFFEDLQSIYKDQVTK